MGDPCPVWARAWQAGKEQDLQHQNRELWGLLEPDPDWDLSKENRKSLCSVSEPHRLSSAGH